MRFCTVAAAFLPLALCAEETVVSSGGLNGLSFDTEPTVPRVIIDPADVFPVAYNNSESWERLGTAGQVVGLSVVEMSAEGGSRGDPSTWVAIGDSVSLPVSAAEGISVWEPGKQGLYRVRMTYPSGTEVIADFDLLDAVFTRKDVAELTVDPISTVTFTGMAVYPDVVVRDGGKVLQEGTDYTLEFQDNVYIGRATVTIRGKGGYSGLRAVSFGIDYQLVASTELGGIDVDLRADVQLVPENRYELLPFAYNDTDAWVCGGLNDGIAKARVSCAPKVDAAADPDETARRVLFEVSGEGVRKVHHCSGWQNFRIDFLGADDAVVSSLARDVFVPAWGLLIFVK